MWQDARCEALAMSQSFRSAIEVMSRPACMEFVQCYSVFKASVRNDDLGRMAQFFMAYYDSVWILLSFLGAVQ